MENEIHVISIPMRSKDDLLFIQKAATAQRKLLPDFIADAVQAVARDCMEMEQERRGQENRRAHRHGVTEGRADTIQAAYTLLRDHGHNEAADMLGNHFTTTGNPNASAPMREAPIEKTDAATVPAERF